MVVAVLLQSFGGEAGGAAPVPVVLAVTPEPVAVQEAAGFSLAEATALRDAAQRLTPAAVALDEQARLHWTPLRAGLDAAAADPRTPASVREELDAARAALDQVGL